MATPAPNLVNLEKVSKAYGATATLLSQVSLGVQRRRAWECIGVVRRRRA